MLYWFNNIWWACVGAIWMFETILMPPVAFAYLMVLLWIAVPLHAVLFGLSLFVRIGDASRNISAGFGWRRHPTDEPVFNFSHKNVRGHIVPDRINGRRRKD